VLRLSGKRGVKKQAGLIVITGEVIRTGDGGKRSPLSTERRGCRKVGAGGVIKGPSYTIKKEQKGKPPLGDGQLLLG